MKTHILSGSSNLEYNATKLDFWLNHLEKLVEIPSASRNPIQVNRAQSYLQELLSSFGFETRRLKGSQPDQGDLLVAEYGSDKKAFVNFICHADTVFDQDELPHQLKVQGKYAYGPGVIDNKGGILVAIYGILKFLKNNSPHVGLRVVCSPNEEIGSPGFHNHFQNLASDAVASLGFEPANSDGSVIVERKGNLWYDIHFEGQKAHAGRDHHRATNACAELAIKMAEIQGFTNYDERVTVNIGKIQGGDKHNVVSHKAYGQLDVRFPCFETRKGVKTKIDQLLSQPVLKTPCGSLSSRIDYQIVDDCPPLAKNNESELWAKSYCEYVKEVESTAINVTHVGGAADCNYFCINKNSVVVDGLGPKGSGMHTHDERIEIESIETRATALSLLLEQINSTQGGLH